MNRAAANWELLQTDRVDGPGPSKGLDTFQNVLVKTHDALANLSTTILSPLQQGQFEVVDRTSPVSATVNALRNTFRARWFGKGNPLNIIAKGVAGLIEVPDGMISDALHLGGRGKVIRQID